MRIIKVLAITLILAATEGMTMASEVNNLDRGKIMRLLSAEEFKNRERLELLRMGERAKIVLRDIIRERENKPPSDLVERAVSVLGEVFRDRASIDLIRLLLRHPDPGVKAAAVRALRYISDESDIPMLTQMLQDSDTFVRFAAVMALGYIGSPKALPALKKVLNEPIYSRSTRARYSDD